MQDVGKEDITAKNKGFVKEVSLSNFMKEVIETSATKLVLVDFWAPWCSPCKQLAPTLEKLVASYKGKISLAKINIDKNPEIAQQMRVQSIPAVFAFFQGQPIDGFLGALPETQIRKWIDGLLKALESYLPDQESFAVEEKLKQANFAFSAGDIPSAQKIYEGILKEDQENAQAYIGMLRCLIAERKIKKAREMFDKAPPVVARDKAIENIRASLELAEQAQEAVKDVEELADKVRKKPEDLQARFDLSSALYAVGRREEAVEELLEIIKRNKSWNEEAARKQLLKIFESLGHSDPLTISARKRLSSILFS